MRSNSTSSSISNMFKPRRSPPPSTVNPQINAWRTDSDAYAPSGGMQQVMPSAPPQHFNVPPPMWGAGPGPGVTLQEAPSMGFPAPGQTPANQRPRRVPRQRNQISRNKYIQGLVTAACIGMAVGVIVMGAMHLVMAALAIGCIGFMVLLGWKAFKAHQDRVYRH